ncbi:hypothetical protein GCM10010095_69920 [Streptomyces anthocyanicus]|nr:hypothetical protein GCM10010095_69920 [Streptomyces anthocyanicus]
MPSAAVASTPSACRVTVRTGVAVRTSGSRSAIPVDAGAGAAGDRAPDRGAADGEHAVVVQEAEQVGGRVAQGGGGVAGPDGGDDGRHEVGAEVR